MEIWRLDEGVTRSVSPENPTGAPGAGGMADQGTGAWAARELGRGWKVSPSIQLADGATATLADISGPGVIRHIWLTTDPTGLRGLVLRVYWNERRRPSIEVPLGDFFCNGWGGELTLVNSAMIVVAPAGGLNSYWPMPFATRARITVENVLGRDVPVYYQVTYTQQRLPERAGYLHAAWRRANPVGSPAIHTVLAEATGPGRYVGTYLAIEPGAPGWWGEGELKFYLDGDDEFPTICGTGTEDYFGGAWNFDIAGRYVPYSTPYLGLPGVRPANQIYRPSQRFGLYRWHVPDPIQFERNARVTMQVLGWRDGGRYLPLERADVATTALWYQSEPTAAGSSLRPEALRTTPMAVPRGRFGAALDRLRAVASARVSRLARGAR